VLPQCIMEFKFWDAAIGGTNSQLGVFRLDRDVLSRHPDLVLLDFSANDDIHSANAETLAAYESLVRRILVDAHAPVIQVIFPFQWDVASGTTQGMLRLKFHGSMVMLFGESTPSSAKFRVLLDGKVVEHKSADQKRTLREFDAADFARRVNGKAYLVQVLAEGLDPEVQHSLEIQPIFAKDTEQELCIESVCVAGGKATVSIP
jgi:hypothetical protein